MTLDFTGFTDVEMQIVSNVVVFASVGILLYALFYHCITLLLRKRYENILNQISEQIEELKKLSEERKEQR